MSCTICKPASEIIDSLRVSDLWCKKKLDRINRILRNFYLSTVWLSDNIEYQPIAGDWLQTIQTEYPVYKVMWFFWSWCWAECYMTQSDKCCGEWTKQLKMYKTNIEPRIWQYRIECEDEIIANIPKWFNWYIVYSKWPKKINSLSDNICINWTMLSWLEYYMEMFYEWVEWDLNRMTISKQNYQEWLDQVKESEENRVFDVNNWEWTMNKR